MILTLWLVAQLANGVPAQDPRPCSATEHRQFDFWLGDWDVRGQKGQLLGTSRITSILDGCAVQEEWTSASGKTKGVSHNAFNPATRRWHQTWVDNSASRLDLIGEFSGSAMVMEQRTHGEGAKIDRITWTPLGDGRVRQVWDVSADGGVTWKTSFDGFYSRR